MFKTVAKDVWAFDVEWVPDADAGRRLHQLPQDLEEAEVFEAMWKAGGATEEEPMPYPKTVLCRVVSIAAVVRKRKDDIPATAMAILKGLKKQHKILVDCFSHDALEVLNSYDWPGNVRELENTLERVVLIHDKPIIQKDDINYILDENSHSFKHIARDDSGLNSTGMWIYGTADALCYQGSNSSTWYTTCDIRLKKNVTNSTRGLAEINQMRIANFEYRKEDEIDMSEFPLADNPKQICLGEGKDDVYTGLIAQEIEQIMPECIVESKFGTKTVSNDPITWALVNAVKELSAEVEQLKSQLNN